ncbi:hypothetical protein BN938_1151 [Mucinivorans hirudinis]|uniref:Uncharacterized protein n=1 Tax=Mucinivorans hirudinis TaxID=1433126 RepID=A0A060R7J2_9BACT|nr:hypothetical protein BN938_1151 [Mucinivorans hirudinis]
MNRYFKYIFFTFLAFLAVSCQRNGFGVDEPVEQTTVSFDVAIGGGYAISQVQTKGTPRSGTTAYENNNKIRVIALEKNVQGSSSNNFATYLYKSEVGEWEYTPKRDYNGVMYDFYAYASDLEKPITESKNENGLSISTTSLSGSIPTLTYEVPEKVDYQPDLIVANSVLDKSKGAVELTFNHALSCVGFVATSKLTGDRKVKSVTIKKVYGKGSLSLAKSREKAFEWIIDKDYGRDITFSAAMNGNNLETDLPTKLDDLMQENGYLMMVPQVLEEGAQIVMEIWDGTDEASVSKITYDIPPSKWEPGKKYMYYFDEPILEGIATYYEKYEDGSYGLYYYDGKDDDAPLNTEYKLEDNKKIYDSGYGLLVPASTYSRYQSIYMGVDDDPRIGGLIKEKSTSDGSIVARLKAFTTGDIEIDCVLYPSSQNDYPFDSKKSKNDFSHKGLQPIKAGFKVVGGVTIYTSSASSLKISAGIDSRSNNIITYNHIFPNYAKGVYLNEGVLDHHSIRTPIQMRNISYQTHDDSPYGTKGSQYILEFSTLDFSIDNKRKIYGSDVSESRPYFESIVVGAFGGIFDGGGDKYQIKGLIISTPSGAARNTALFEHVWEGGELKNCDLLDDCIIINHADNRGKYLAGFAARNDGLLYNLINNASITNFATYIEAEEGTSVGGIVGLNTHKVKLCRNKGAIKNLNAGRLTKTGGIAAYNEKAYKWAGLDPTDQNKFISMEKADFDEMSPPPSALTLQCDNEAEILGSAITGGIAGYNNFGGVIWNCNNYKSAKITYNDIIFDVSVSIGGVVGMQQAGEYHTKDIIPRYYSIISNCKNYADVIGLHKYGYGAHGGIVGVNDYNADGREDLGHLSPSCWGRVMKCGNYGNVSGIGRSADQYSSTVGGIAGTNNGAISQSECRDITVEGSGILAGVGGIAGFNTTYIGDCLFYSQSSSCAITVVNGTARLGGISGMNDEYSDKFKSESGYITRCLFIGRAPHTEANSTNAIPGLSPITVPLQYLYRNDKGKLNMADANSGATPLYTVEQCYFLSEGDYNPMSVEKEGGLYEPAPDEVFTPFAKGRYHIGTKPLKNSQFHILSSLHPKWKTYWTIPSSGYPYLISTPQPSSISIPSGQTLDIEAVIINYLETQIPNTGTPTYQIHQYELKNGLRINLMYINKARIENLSQFTLDFSNTIFTDRTVLNNNAYGALVVRAPIGWQISSTNNPTPYPGGESQYVYITNDTGKTVTFTKQ